MEFRTVGGADVQIDLVIVLHDIVVLCDAKCFLWAEDAIEFADYRDKMVDASLQVQKQLEVVRSDLGAFGRRVAETGHQLPASPRILGCILSNTATLVGICVEGIPVIDMPLLEEYLLGQYVEREVWDGDRLVEQQSVQLYENSLQAAERLESFFMNPPQVQMIRRAAKSREISVRLAPGREGYFVCETFQVALPEGAD